MLNTRRLVCSLAFLIACGGKTRDSTLAPSCPASAPASGSSCNAEGMQCEYGGDLRSACDTVVACTAGAWTVAPIDTGDCPTPPNLGACPATAKRGDACDSSGLVCNYSTSSQTRECFCVALADAGSATWQCSAPASGCPSARPTIGAPCAEAPLTCDYAACGIPDGLAFLCSAATSTWIAATSPLCSAN